MLGIGPQGLVVRVRVSTTCTIIPGDGDTSVVYTMIGPIPALSPGLISSYLSMLSLSITLIKRDMNLNGIHSNV